MNEVVEKKNEKVEKNTIRFLMFFSALVTFSAFVFNNYLLVLLGAGLIILPFGINPFAFFAKYFLSEKGKQSRMLDPNSLHLLMLLGAIFLIVAFLLGSFFKMEVEATIIVLIIVFSFFILSIV